MTSIQIPPSTSTVQVSIIDTTTHLSNIPPETFFGPGLEGYSSYHACAYAFLVTHTDATTKRQRRVVFDLGPPKDWQHDMAPAMAERIQGWDIKIDKYVSEILEEEGVGLDGVEAVIWSHAHFDHTGRMDLFPASTTLVTGPGVKQANYPGYPANPATYILERDFAGRDVVEVDFNRAPFKIGGFDAVDYFDDGSFYLLSAPGHATGHVNGLARTTTAATDGSPTDTSTFILMGADSFHHCSQLRPNTHTPLPDTIPGPIPHMPEYDMHPCPGHIFDGVHPSSPHRKATIPTRYSDEMAAGYSDPRTSPYFTISVTAEGNSIASDRAAAKATIAGLQAFDADEHVFLVAAHDTSLYEVLDFFPRTANEWKAKGWKEQGRWRFLGDLNQAVEMAKERTK